MPGNIQVSVLGFKRNETSSASSDPSSVKVSMGKREYQTSDTGDFTFALTTLRDKLKVKLVDGTETSLIEVETRLIIEKGLLEETFDFGTGGNVQLKLQFVLSEEDRDRIRLVRQTALRKKHEELVNNNIQTGKPKNLRTSMSSPNISGLSSQDLQTTERKTVLAAGETSPRENVRSSETPLETRNKNDAKRIHPMYEVAPETLQQPKYDLVEVSQRDMRNSFLDSAKIELSEDGKIQKEMILQKNDTKLKQQMSEVVSAKVSKRDEKNSVLDSAKSKLSEDGKLKTVSKEAMGRSKREEAVKDRLETQNVLKKTSSSARKMISNFEIRPSQVKKPRPTVTQTDSTKSSDSDKDFRVVKPPDSSRNAEGVKIEREETVIKENALLKLKEPEKEDDQTKQDCPAEPQRGSDKTLKRSFCHDFERKDPEKEEVQQKPDCTSQPERASDKTLKSLFGQALEHSNLRSSHLWIFPEESRTCITTGAKLLETKSCWKKNVCGDEKVTNGGWKNCRKLSKPKPESSSDSGSSEGPIGQMVRAGIMVGFAALVLLTR